MSWTDFETPDATGEAIDEAIERAKADGDWQLAGWLRHARGARKASRWLTAKVRELEEEAARLRSALGDTVENARLIEGENEALRELVRDMFGYATHREMELCNACIEADGDFASCNACDEYDGACGIAKKRFEELYAEKLRELGMEAEG